MISPSLSTAFLDSARNVKIKYSDIEVQGDNMASTRIVYEIKDEKGGTRFISCFRCAVRKAMEDVDCIISIETDDYAYHQCFFCGKFIEDSITI